MLATDDVETAPDLRAPFPWFGGKRRVASLVWSRLGDVRSYNEPFFGSGAVLLGRPHPPRVETINDLDSYVANFWRALQHDPEAVAFWADTPVNEADLHARHRWLVTRGRRLAVRLLRDPDYFNAKVAGWWVYGQCLWIGSGWCEAKRPPAADRNGQGTVHQRRRPQRTGDQGVVIDQKMPRAENHVGVHRIGLLEQKRPKLPERGYPGVARRWQGGGQGGGSGVHAPTLAQQKPDLSGDSGAVGRGIFASRLAAQFDKSAQGHGITAEGFERRTGGLYRYLEQLAARLRRVRVCCGDWTRILTPSVTTYVGLTGVFLDPPYRQDQRQRCYSEDHDISAAVAAWARAHGDDPLMRIALCGYEGEHVMPETWECVRWKAHGGYSRTERGVANRSRERIWFSPHCLRPSDVLPLERV